MKIKSTICVAAAFIVALGTAFAAEPANHYIVVGQTNSLPADIAESISANGGTVTGGISQIGLAFATSRDPDFVANMSGVAGVRSVIQDLVVPLEDPFDDDSIQSHDPIPFAPDQQLDGLLWGLDTVGAQAAWAAGNTGAGVRVAVLDAGIDHTHPDLAPNLNAGLSASFVPCFFGLNCDGAVEDWRISDGFYFNHGTHVSGTIAGTGDDGVHGVAPDAEIVAVKVCTEFANACFTSAILSGLVYAADIDADLVNMSLGGLRRMRNDFVKQCKDAGNPARVCAQLAGSNAQFQDDYVQQAIIVYKRAFEYAYQNGTTVITSSGNSALNSDTSKDIWLAFADFPHTIAVNALGPVGWCLGLGDVDSPAYYTNYGQSTSDVAAPGGNAAGLVIIGTPPYTDNCTVDGVTRPAWAFDMVLSTISEGWGWAQGTSMAAPHATGVAALLISANGGPMSPAQVEQALKATAHDLGQPGHDAIYGSGRVYSGY